MSESNQHSDLLFDFGPRGAGQNRSPLDWVPVDNRPFDSQVSDALPTFDLTSTGPLPPTGPMAGPSPGSTVTRTTRGFWLDGDVLMCSCPECRAPMSVRVWLMVADCWNCGISIELSEEQIREAERILQGKSVAVPAVSPPPKPIESPKAPVAKQPASPPRAPAAAPVQRPPPPPARPHVPPRPPVPPPSLPGRSKTAAPAALPAEEDYFDILRSLFRDLPAWLISFIIHLALLMLLALIQRPVEETGEEITLSATISSVRNEEGDVVHIPQTPEAKFDLPLPDKDELADPVTREALLAANQEARALRLDPSAPNQRLPDLRAVKRRIGSAQGIRNGFVARDPRLRVEMVQKEGGTTLTEAAVARALRWFQRHQSEDGHWSLNRFRSAGQCSCGHEGYIADDTGGTSLALLPYLGAGQTHLVGIYKDEVAQGLRWLVRHQKPDGDLRVTTANSGMYAHGQATIVLCEAFAITGDEELRGPAQKAVDFIVEAQYHDGGWRYLPEPAGQQGDTSVVGWQLMALQSARAANLTVPEHTFSRANAFLDRVQHRNGARYGYQQHSGPTPVMTAEGLLCRLYLGWTKDEIGLNQGVKYLLESHPPRANDLGIYYWYYATQTLHHYGGEEWDEWNRQMREVLVDSQQKEGHAAGSWVPVGQHSDVGGRIYMTSLAACTLEVYYRHLPVFRQIKVD